MNYAWGNEPIEQYQRVLYTGETNIEQAQRALSILNPEKITVDALVQKDFQDVAHWLKQNKKEHQKQIPEKNQYDCLGLPNPQEFDIDEIEIDHLSYIQTSQSRSHECSIEIEGQLEGTQHTVCLAAREKPPNYTEHQLREMSEIMTDQGNLEVL